jgi:hypothetical protein
MPAFLPAEYYDTARLRCTTADGGISAADGPDTWAKIVSISSTVAADRSHLLLAFANWTSEKPESAIVSFGVSNMGLNVTPVVSVSIVAKGEAAHQIDPNSFKVVNGGWGTPTELWVKKGDRYGGFKVYELARGQGRYATITYNDLGAWQAAAPVGAVTNVTTSGVQAFGAPVLTTSTGVQGSKAGTAAGLTLWTGTKAQYDAIATKDANTIYVVTTAAATLEGVVDGVTSGVDTGQISSEETVLESAQSALDAVQTGDIVVDPPARTATTKSTRKK